MFHPSESELSSSTFHFVQVQKSGKCLDRSYVLCNSPSSCGVLFSKGAWGDVTTPLCQAPSSGMTSRDFWLKSLCFSQLWMFFLWSFWSLLLPHTSSNRADDLKGRLALCLLQFLPLMRLSLLSIAWNFNLCLCPGSWVPSTAAELRKHLNRKTCLFGIWGLS